MLSERPDGVFVVDMTHFDEIVPTEPTQTFPYPAPVSMIKPSRRRE